MGDVWGGLSKNRFRDGDSPRNGSEPHALKALTKGSSDLSTDSMFGVGGGASLNTNGKTREAGDEGRSAGVGDEGRSVGEGDGGWGFNGLFCLGDPSGDDFHGNNGMIKGVKGGGERG